jgi:hypothetical protein
LRGPFKHKKAQEAFERRTHRRLLRVVGEASQIDKFAAYTDQHVLPDMYLSLKHVTVPRHDALLRFSLSSERSIRLAQQEEALRVRRHEDAEAQLAQLDQLRAEIDDAIAKVKESKKSN